MKLEPECIGCIFNQVLKAFKLIDPEISHDIIITAQKKVMKFLLNFDEQTDASPILGKVAYGIVSDVLGDPDPYSTLKQESNKLGLGLFEEVKEIIDKADDPLFEAIIVSALGNTIDFASQHEIDLISDIRNFSVEDLVINDYNLFKDSLEKANFLLILGDNAGEIVFDKLLILIIKKLYPDLEIVYSVRSEPIINDATIEDAKFINLTELVKVVESSPTPGIDLDSSTEEFKHIFFRKGGIILSKGQGNFESLYGIEIPNEDVYYLLKAKCNLMERIFNVKLGDLIFKRKTKEF
ncbi:MAG: DUF89 domain-containing protein [Candidatus Hermodarchaeota archaeon]